MGILEYLLVLIDLALTIGTTTELLLVDPLIPKKLKFKFKSKKGLAYYALAAGVAIPGTIAFLAPFIFKPRIPSLVLWQTSCAAWLLVILQLLLRNYAVTAVQLAFSIGYFALTAVLYIMKDDVWLLLASGAAAVPACIAVVIFATKGIRVVRRRRGRTVRFRDISHSSDEDELLLSQELDALDKEDSKDSAMPPDFKNSSALRLLAFSFMTPIIKIGSERQINREDLPELATRMKSDEVGRKEFNSVWKAESMNANPSLSNALIKVFGRELLFAGIIKVANDICNFLQPLILQSIILFLQDYQQDKAELSYGLWLCVGLMLSYFVQSASFNQYFHWVNVVAARSRSALMWMVFDKSCKLSADGRSHFSSGAVQNLMANDSRHLSDLVMYLNYLWSGVFQICIAFFLLVRMLGIIPTMAGIALCCVNSPIQAQIVTRIRRARERALKATDERVKTLSEIFQGIKVIKFYAWEDSFIARVLQQRDEEIKWIKSSLLYSAGMFTAVSTLPVILSTVVIGVYSLMGNDLDPAILFPAIALLNVLRAPLLFLPNVLVLLAQAKASINRLEEFFAAHEVSPRNRKRMLAYQSQYDSGVDIIAVNATFSWDRSLSSIQRVQPATLSGVSLQVREGELCVVIGQTGSGKSTLLSGLLNEAFLIGGYCGIRPGTKVAFVDQTAFIFNASLRDNILFGKEYNAERYAMALRVTALDRDLELLQSGDQTEIGSRGVNLSGGQRQRVSLARAVYSDADVYLLDDPLSAVDASVGKHIFDECIVGALKNKSRVFVTNELHNLNSPHVKQICLLNNGQVSERGTYSELMAKDGALATLVKNHAEVEAAATVEAASDDEEQSKKAEPASATDDTEINGTGGNLTGIERREIGRVRLAEYDTYIQAMGGRTVALALIVLMAGSQFVGIGSTYWLSLWSAAAIEPDPGFAVYFGVYVLLGMMSVLITAVAVVSLAHASVRASRHMHQKMLLHVFGAPMSWFDSTPTGRLINRFNADVDKIDSTLGQALQGFMRQFLSLLAILVLIISGIPLFIIPILGAAYFYYRAQDYYRRSSVDLRRLEAIVRSPLYNHFTETLDGLVTLRAYGQIWRAQRLNQDMVDMNALVSFANLCANRWLSVRLEMLSIVLVFFVSFISVLSGKSLNPAFGGLMLSFALQLTTSVNWVIRSFTEAESQMAAVERISEYSAEPGVPQEEKVVPGQARLSVKRFWPREGRIDFKNISMKYRDDLPPVLNDISFSVSRGEKVGICGRTGAGKSSLVNVLFRLNPLQSGSVLIDDVDTGQVSLKSLRGALTILPQEPLIFSGTFRNNLDPFSERLDEEIWQALRTVGLEEVVAAAPGGLDAAVAEGGSNLSVGQRQLLCLGRALLRDTTILVLDEATSGVDIETDEQVQRTLAKRFGDCTTLTIAHRLNTIITYDKILVLDAGKVCEFDTPKNLLDKPDSVFSSLVNELGPSMAKKMREVAASGKTNTPDQSDNGFSALVKKESLREPQRESLKQEQIRRAFLDIRNAIVNHDAVDWTVELSKTKVNKREWSTQLYGMSEKLYKLSQAYLHDRDFKFQPHRVEHTLEDTHVPTLNGDSKADLFEDAEIKSPSFSTASLSPSASSMRQT